jgi:hypothetical protein
VDGLTEDGGEPATVKVGDGAFFAHIRPYLQNIAEMRHDARLIGGNTA